MYKALCAVAFLLTGTTPLLADSPCAALASRVSPGAVLASSLTTTLCSEALSRKWLSAEELPAISTAPELRAALQKGSALDLLDLGQAMFESFERASRPASGEWILHDTEHYRFVTRAGSPAARDLDLIGAEAERSRDGIARAFGIAEAIAASERVVSSAGLPEPLKAEPSPRVVVFLHASRQDDSDKRIGRHSMGSTQFSATIEERRGRLGPSIHVLYFNPFSLAVLEHEIAHATVMLAAFDSAAIDVPLADEKSLKTAFFKGYRQMPAFVSEGIGDYGLYYAGFYPAWGALGSPEALAFALLTAGKLPPLEKLLRSDALMHAREHKTFSLASATFLRFLQQNRDAEALHGWLFDDQGSPGAFRQRFGIELSSAERDWRVWLGENQDSRP